jgi:phosphoribosylformylglycinamidine cyclo-ligase
MNNKYQQRGVSAQKEDVHQAVKSLDKGLFPNAFCKIYPDTISNDPNYGLIMHADGAGTKSSLAYLYWKETNDLSVWKGIAIDAIVMNIDDMLCAGAVGPFTFSSTIGRNKRLIPGEVIAEVINGSQAYFDKLRSYGVDVHFLGGETADVGDLVRTIIVDGTMTCRIPLNEVIDPSRIEAGDVVISFASYGQTIWEETYNSGMGSNGLTSARHDLLNKTYLEKYPESLDTGLNHEVVYCGPYLLTDKTETDLNVGQMLLSPTRTYAPFIMALKKANIKDIHAMIHCSGGGQSKVMHYMPEGLEIIKDNLLPIPPLFKMIKEATGTDWHEMYQVFNMGQRLELYVKPELAQPILDIAQSMQLDAQISGRVIKGTAGKKKVSVLSPDGYVHYEN